MRIRGRNGRKRRRKHFQWMANTENLSLVIISNSKEGLIII